MTFLFIFFICFSSFYQAGVIVNTWGQFSGATKTAFEQLRLGKSRLDAIEKGCSWCEEHQCDGTVGFGGSPDEKGETTLDAMIMDGKTRNAGSVGALRRVKSAISVARYVMEHTTETLLVGDQATDFAIQMGFPEQSLETPQSREQWKKWQMNNCQPNYRVNVTNQNTCGPYKPIQSKQRGGAQKQPVSDIGFDNHDSIAMIALDDNSDMAVGVSTNGARWKIPGRVGDSPIIGAGAYVDNEAGGCGATGDGDIMMRFLPCFKAVDLMKSGMHPTLAAEKAIEEIAKYFPHYVGAIVVLNKQGISGGAAHGWTFTYAYQNSTSGPIIYTVTSK